MQCVFFVHVLYKQASNGLIVVLHQKKPWVEVRFQSRLVLLLFVLFVTYLYTVDSASAKTSSHLNWLSEQVVPMLKSQASGNTVLFKKLRLGLLGTLSSGYVGF